MSNQKVTVFTTKGKLDLACLTTFGVSVKETANPIGRFGTGLKYALAILLRHGAEVIISTGGAEYKLMSQEEQIRGRTFDRAYLAPINGGGSTIDLPFTSELGKDWELWQAFREIYSNTLDEGGQLSVSDNYPPTFDFNTTIIVAHEAFAEIAENKDDYFKQDKTEALKTDLGYIHPNDSTNSLFYKGIAVAELHTPTVHAYDVAKAGYHLELTEDRTVKYSWEVKQNIANLLLQCGDVDVVREAITAPLCNLESELDFTEDFYGRAVPSDAFLGAVEEELNNPRINKTAVELWEVSRPLAFRFTEDEELTPFDKLRIQNIIGVIRDQMGLKNADQYKVIPAAKLPNGTKCLQDPVERVIIVDSNLIKQDALGYELAKVLAGSLFEMEDKDPLEPLLEICGFQKGAEEKYDPNYIPF